MTIDLKIRLTRKGPGRRRVRSRHLSTILKLIDGEVIQISGERAMVSHGPMLTMVAQQITIEARAFPQHAVTAPIPSEQLRGVNDKAYAQTYDYLRDAIAAETFEDVSKFPLCSLVRIGKYGIKHSLVIELIPFDDSVSTSIGVISNQAVLDKMQNKFIRGKTTIYARLLRVGGRKNSSLTVEMLTSKQRLKIAINQDVAIRLGGHLHQKVELKGDAIWAPTYEMELIHFTMREYRLMPKFDPQLMAEKLSKISGFDRTHTDRSNSDGHDEDSAEDVK